MREDDTEGGSKWQPVIVMLRGGGRLECECGALATVVIGTLNKAQDNELEEVGYFCQDCYLKGQKAVEDETR